MAHARHSGRMAGGLRKGLAIQCQSHELSQRHASNPRLIPDDDAATPVIPARSGFSRSANSRYSTPTCPPAQLNEEAASLLLHRRACDTRES